MTREALEEVALSFGVIAASIGVILIVQILAPTLLDAITGRTFEEVTTTTKVNVIGTVPRSCNTTLEAGWNLASFFCLTNGMPIGQGLQPIQGSLVKVFTYVPGSSDPWKVYAPALPNWTVQDLSLIYRDQGYWIYLASSSAYYYNGTQRLSNTIALTPGWNLIGYPSNGSRDINASLGPAQGIVLDIRAYNASAPAWLFFPPTTATDSANVSLSRFSPYWGYWVYANASTSFDVTW